jgi:hypothetical protein
LYRITTTIKEEAKKPALPSIVFFLNNLRLLIFCPRTVANVSPIIVNAQDATTIGFLYNNDVMKHPKTRNVAPLKRLNSCLRKNEPKKRIKASLTPSMCNLKLSITITERVRIKSNNLPLC